MDAALGRSGGDRRKLRRGGGFLVAALVLGIAPATAHAQPSDTPPTLETPATIVSEAAVEEEVPPPPVAPVPVLEIVSGVPGIEAAALADTLEPRVAGFTLVAETTAAVVPGAYRLEVASAPDGTGLRLLLRNAEGRALVRDVASGGEASADEPLRLVAVLASHMLEELVLLERPPTPVAPPPVIVPPPPPPPPPPPELPPPPEPPPPPPFELGVFGGIQGNDLGGSPAGAGTGWTVFLRGAYSILPWLGVALESGWSGIASDEVDGLFSIVPLRVGLDFGINIAILRASVGARLTVDVWTAKVDRRETGSRVGGGLFSTVAIFPWENLGFGLAAAMDLFPVAVQLRANDEDVFSLGWLRFLFSAGIVARM